MQAPCGRQDEMRAKFPRALCDNESSNRGKLKTCTQRSPMLVANRDRVEARKVDTMEGSDEYEDEVDDELEEEFFIVKTVKNHYVDRDVSMLRPARPSNPIVTEDDDDDTTSTFSELASMETDRG
ncbi:hypothetical protein EDB80DRAFT_899085 [Ilyonectria destructans]|nr:hypothetical protein EDB80DRAFT_899085 [Ilyonectria destructans]